MLPAKKPERNNPAATQRRKDDGWAVVVGTAPPELPAGSFHVMQIPPKPGGIFGPVASQLSWYQSAVFSGPRSRHAFINAVIRASS